MVDLLLAWHLHHGLGLTGTQTGWALFAFLSLGGAVTFAVGSAFTRSGASDVAVVRTQLAATIVVAPFLLLQFRVEGATAAIAVGLVFRIAYAVQDVAQNMLASLLPEDEEDVRRYARLRVALSAATRCGVAGAFAVAMSGGMTAVLALIGIVMIASAVALLPVRFPERSRIGSAPRSGGATIPIGMPRLILAWSAAAALLPTLNRLLVFTPPMPGLPRPGAWLLAGFCLGSVLGPILRDSGGRAALLAVILTSGLAIVLPLPYFPHAILSVGGAMMHGAAISVIGVRLWSATASVATADAGRGRNGDGLVFGSVILTIHLSSAAGMLVLGSLIERFEAGGSSAPAIALLITFAGAVLIARLGISGRTVPEAA